MLPWKNWLGTRAIEQVVVDPSAAQFSSLHPPSLRFRVLPADNRVKEGIQLVSEALLAGEYFSPQCADTIREFPLPVGRRGEADKPVKEFDHAMDDIRYFAMAAMQEGNPVLRRECGSGMTCSQNPFPPAGRMGTAITARPVAKAKQYEKGGGLFGLFEFEIPQAWPAFGAGSAGNPHPFSPFGGLPSLCGCDGELYACLREAVPIIDAAIDKIVRLTSGFTVLCEGGGRPGGSFAVSPQVPVRRADRHRPLWPPTWTACIDLWVRR